MTFVIRQIMEGLVENSVMGAFLTALRIKGETVPEIVAAAKVMREKAESLKVPDKLAVDTCGTGGDGADTFNISTASAFVAAGAGIVVAKHGNRAVSSRAGSADVLKSLGVNIEAEKSVVERCLDSVGIGFLFAPSMHKAMKYAKDVRRELGLRTIFNLLGPLTNPAKVKAQVIGVFDGKWVVPLAHVLKGLGCQQAFVVHGSDGLDEITLTDSTKISHLTNGNIKEILFSPEEVGLDRCSPEDLKGGSAEDNAKIIKEVLEGKPGPKRDIVLINSSAAITVAGKAGSLKDGLELARKSIDSGAAKEKLHDLCRVSNS
jgi:anthranilate phosphoribosyltransferase